MNAAVTAATMSQSAMRMTKPRFWDVLASGMKAHVALGDDDDARHDGERADP